jgi:hypothetical protein
MGTERIFRFTRSMRSRCLPKSSIRLVDAILTRAEDKGSWMGSRPAGSREHFCRPWGDLFAEGSCDALCRRVLAVVRPERHDSRVEDAPLLQLLERPTQHVVRQRQRIQVLFPRPQPLS